jgi:hypothetical protein
MSFDNFKTGYRCPCMSQRVKKIRESEETKEKVLNIIKESGLTFKGYNDDILFSWKSYIILECKNGHITKNKVHNWLKYKTCKVCSQLHKIEIFKSRTGCKSGNWKGGLTEFRKYIKTCFKEWKKESIKRCDYKSIISGKKFDVIHHLYSFNLIVREALDCFGIEEKEYIGDYPENTLLEISSKVNDLHYNYPFGVCLTNKEHKLFHSLYGYGNNTPDQFTEFLDKIKNKEIFIN